MRSGDIAEQLGILLLQSVALVAPVPRTEDVGIDVVVTLIKNYDLRKYVAEESFAVQIKSSSIEEIPFQDDEVKWLHDLQLPLFIASVDRKTSTIKLYSTQSLSVALAESPDREKINLQLLQNYEGDFVSKESSLNLPIGPPVIEWSLDLIASDPQFIKEFYKLMKAHVILAKRSIETRRVGFIEVATWKTGNLPVVREKRIHPTEDKVILDEIAAPYFHAVLNNIFFSKDMFTIRSLYRALEKIIEIEEHFEIVKGKRELKKWIAPEYDEFIKLSGSTKDDP